MKYVFLIFSILFLALSQYNFLFFHTLAELFFAFVCFYMYLMAVYIRRVSADSLLLYLASGYFWVAMIDVIHAFSYKGMSVFIEGNSNIAVQFWLVARYTEAFVLVTAAIFVRRELQFRQAFLFFSIISFLACSLIFSGYFPIGFDEENGLTKFKVVSEYLIIALLFVAAFLFAKTSLERKKVFLIQLAIVATIVAEFCFTLYADVYGLLNATGHIFKLISGCLLLHVVALYYVEKPYKELIENESKFRRLFQQSDVSIWNEDFSTVYRRFRQLKSKGIKDLERHIDDNPELAWELANSVVVKQVNDATLSLFEAKTNQDFIDQIEKSFGDDAIEVFKKLLLSIWQEKKVFRSEANYVTFTGRKITAIITFQIPEKEAEFRSIPVSIIDITPQKEYQEKITQQANYDFLTHLPNRNLFNDRLSHALEVAKRNESTVYLLYLDLDGFKHINDSLGHDYGDVLLQQVAERLRQQVRKSDTVARLGGDEFAILMEYRTNEHDKDVVLVANKLIESIKQPFDLVRGAAYVSASVGVTSYPKDGDNLTVLLRKADSAMYRAKTNSTQNIQFFDVEMEKAVQKRLSLEQALRQANVDKHFELHFQPVVNNEGKILYFEALIRWNNEGDFIPPDEFIPLAEEIGLIEEIGGWVLFEACRNAKRWNDLSRGKFGVSVNISSKQFYRENLADLVAKATEESGLSPRLLTLEITESLLFDNVERVIHQLHDIREMNVKIAMDDFGTGYSSLSYLTKLPIDIIKVDRSFITKLFEEEKNKTLVEAILHMSSSLNLSVVVEGVETKQQVEYIQKLGCDYFQGYYFSKPMYFTQVMEWLGNKSNSEN